MTDAKEILQRVSSGTLSAEEAEKILNEQKEISNISLKLSTKGCISIYGIRRMPISLYPNELELIIKALVKNPVYTDFYKNFLIENENAIKMKKDKE